MKLNRINVYLITSLIVILTNLKGTMQTEFKKFELKTGHVKFVGEPEYENSQSRTIRAADPLSSVRPRTSTFSQTLTSFANPKNTISHSKSDKKTISNTVLTDAIDLLSSTTTSTDLFKPNQTTNATSTPSKPRNSTIKNEIAKSNETNKFTLNQRLRIKTNTKIPIGNRTENSTADNRHISSLSESNYVINLTPFTTFSKPFDGGPVSHEEIGHKISRRKITNPIHHDLIGQTFSNSSNSTVIGISNGEKSHEKAITSEINTESIPNLSTNNDSTSTVSDEIFVLDEDLSHLNETGNDNENENLILPDRETSERIELYGFIVAEERYIILTAGCVIPVSLSTVILVVLGWKRYKNQRQTQNESMNSPIRRYL